MPHDIAFNGRILHVNLTSGEIDVETLPESMYRQLLGGYGLGARLLFDRVPADADPLGPDNVLGFFPGLLTGTPLFGQRFQVVCKSPKNGGWGDSSCGGDFGPALKRSGYDGILFGGQSERPVYLYVDDRTAELCDASRYRGMLAIDCEELLKQELGDEVSVAVIGPAGEQRSYMAGICHDRGRLAARSGVGAVMGSKLLKAVVVRPADGVVARSAEVLRAARSALAGFDRPSRRFLTSYGSSGLTAGAALSGDSPVMNWGGVGIVNLVGEFEMSGLGGASVNERMEGKYACGRCPVACGAESVDGADRGLFAFPRHTHRPEHQTMAAFGPLSGNNDLDSLIAINHWCNQYGLDTISTGATIAFAVECYERGLLTVEDTGGVRLSWGDGGAILELVHGIGRRDEGIGDLLADGSRIAAGRIGGGAAEYAMQIDGEELPMHDPKLDAGYGVSYKLDPTPARHTLWAAGNSVRFPGVPGLPADAGQAGGRGPRHKAAHEFGHLMNAAGVCSFVTAMAPNERIPEWINVVTGWDTTSRELMQVGERIANLRLAFAVKHGNNPARRSLPRRVTGDPPQAVGPLAGITVDIDTMQREWMDEAGWDRETSKPSREKLESLGLADVADAIDAP